MVGDLLLGDYSRPFGTVLGQTVGNTLALVIAALVLRRLTGGRGESDRNRDWIKVNSLVSAVPLSVVDTIKVKRLALGSTVTFTVRGVPFTLEAGAGANDRGRRECIWSRESGDLGSDRRASAMIGEIAARLPHKQKGVLGTVANAALIGKRVMHG